jgi:outer membrane protein
MNRRSLLSILLFSTVLLPFAASGEVPLELTLEDALNLCLDRSREIESARQKVLEAEGGVVSARAGFLPKITASASYTRLSEVPSLEMTAPIYGILPFPVIGPLGDTIGYTYIPGIVGEDQMSFDMGDEDNYAASVGLTQPLFTWGRTVNGYNLASHNLSAARYEYSRTRQDAVFDVTKYFYSVLVAKEFLSLTEESYRQVERHAETAAKLYEEGKISKLDLMRANVARENMKPQTLKAKNGLELATDGLKFAMGLDVAEEIIVSGTLDYSETTCDLQGELREAKENRSDLKAMRERREMAKRALAIAQAGNKPTIVAMANYEYKKPYNFGNDWGQDWNATVALSIPLFSGFATVGESRRAGAMLEQTEIALDVITSAAELEVKSACLALEEANEAIRSQKKNVEEAEEAHRIAERQFENGLLSNLEYLDTQVALSQARANYIKALGDFNIARAQLDRAVGRENRKGELGQ